MQIIDSTIDSKASNDKTIIVYVAQSGFVDVNYHDLLVATLPAGSYRADDNHTIVRVSKFSFEHLKMRENVFCKCILI